MLRRTLLSLTMILPALAAQADSRIAGTGTLERVLKEVSKRQKNIKSLQADFRQEKQMALFASPEVSSGTFVFSKPNRVRWNYVEPKPVTMVIANGVLTTWYPDLNKAESLTVKRSQDRIFRYMGASGAIDELAKFFDFTFIDSKQDRFYLLDLKPKTRTLARRVRRIKIWIERDTYLTSKFEYVEGDGDVTRYEFTNVRLNAPIPAERFTLNLPSTVKIEEMKLN